MVKISIIVPVYNVEAYLERCIESMLNQTLKEIEIILVDDASTDNSRRIMESYEKEFPDKIKCIYLKENIHQGGARNKGLEIAEGEYITYVDSDDQIDITMCEQLYNKALENDSDMVFCDAYKVYENKGEKVWFSYVFEQQMGEQNHSKKESLIIADGYACTKIIKRQILVENNIEYPAHMKYEDFATIPLMTACCNRCSKVSKPLYYYYLREDSTSQKKNGNQHYDYKKAGEILAEKSKDMGIYTKLYNAIDVMEMYGTIFGIQKVLKFVDNPDLEKLFGWTKQLAEKYPDYKNNPYYFYKNEVVGLKAMEYADKSLEEFKEAYDAGEFLEKNNHYYGYYGKYKETIIELLEKLKKTYGNIAIWGAGKKGQDFLQICDSDNRLIEYVIDKNKAKWGERTNSNHLITGFDNVKENIGVVLSMNKNYHEGIKYDVKAANSGIKLVNLDIYILLANEQNWKEFVE